ncbi:MAG: DUF5060 domain-containing protein [Candidatus Binatia bacterium]|nr:DUF5060 domain-containing protein [Candidatus Binatia bacterium]
MGCRLLLASLFLIAVAGGCGGSGDAEPAVDHATQGEPFEVTLDRAVVEPNPFDPRQVQIDGEFLSPRGQRFTIPAFVWQAFERALVGGFERLTPASELQWKVRFTPTESGTWRWRWRLHSLQGSNSSEWRDLEVAPAPVFHGFVRPSPRDTRYLEFDDGNAFVPIGENMCWYDGRGTFAYEEWISRLAAHGGNFIRIWMPSWAFGLEWIERGADGAVVHSSLGNYTRRLDRAWQLDSVVELARRHGIQIMLSIQNHGPFSLTNNSEWADCPYNAANGGPLTHPSELFTKPEAIRLFKQRLRYIVGRWGYATNIMTWELWNEVDLVDQPGSDALVSWHREMAAELRSLDPYARMISTSTSLSDVLAPSATFSALWALDTIDYTQAHYYSFGVPTDFTRVFPAIFRRLARYQKPVFISEAGVDFRGPAETIEQDPNADGFHDLLWAALFSGTLGIGMTWWWDNVVHPLDLYFHFRPLATLVRGVDFPGEGFRIRSESAVAPDGRPLQAFLLVGRSTVLAWVRNARHHYAAPDPAEIRDARLRLADPANGRWSAQWIDTRTATIVREDALEATSNGVEFTVPSFARDIALRMRLAEP